MQCHNKRVSAERCIFHSNRSARTDRGGERPRPPSWNRGWSGRDSNSTGKGQRSAVHKEKEEKIPKRPLKNPLGYDTPCRLLLSLQRRSTKSSPFTPRGSQSIADSSPKAFYIPGCLTSAWAPRPTAFELPAALVGETRQMQQQQGVLASRIPGCRRGIHASTRGCSARSLPVPRLAMAATAAAPAPRMQQVQGSGGEEGAAAAAAAAGAARLPLLHRVTLS